MTSMQPEARALEIDALVQQNLSTRREVETWIAGQKEKILQDKQEHAFLAQEHARQTHVAQQSRDQLQQQHQQLASNCYEKENTINAHEVEIEVLESEKVKKEPILQELFQRHQQEGAKLKQLMAESEQQQATQEQMLAELNQGLAVYQRLGLFFEHTAADVITVKFTQIDRSDRNRVFSFRIRIHPETDRFIVDECSPPVASLPELVEDLNQSGNLSFFLRAMRREFKWLL